MVNNVRDLFGLLETFEGGLNIVGYVPLAGSVSAGVRDVYSKIEVVIGVALVVFSMGMFIQRNPGHLSCRNLGLTLIGHGILNKIRTYCEMTPFFALITTLPYDLFTGFWIGRRIFAYI